MVNNVVAMTYSTPDFEEFKLRNKDTALRIGKVSDFLDFGPDDIELDFWLENKKIFSTKRGAGLWLWKPYFIYRVLNNVRENDIVLYTDSATYFVKNISSLVRYFDTIGQDVMGFDLPLQSDQWTKEETFVLMNATASERSANQVLASFILIKKTSASLAFVKEWLDSCCKHELISDQVFFPHIINPDYFVDHRHDQSIFSILYLRHGYRPHRDPSQFGILFWEYILSRDIIFRPSQKYNSKEYSTIFFHTRNVRDIRRFHLRTCLKLLLAKLPMYRNWEISRRKEI